MQPMLRRVVTSSLICEAAFLIDSQSRMDAVRKHHSITTEALGVAQCISAQACVPTHLSPTAQSYFHEGCLRFWPKSVSFQLGHRFGRSEVPSTKHALSGGLIRPMTSNSEKTRRRANAMSLEAKCFSLHAAGHFRSNSPSSSNQ